MRALALGLVLWGLGVDPVERRTARLRSISIRQFAFAPAQTDAVVGDTVEWVNDDPFGHTTASDVSAWTSPEIARGGRFVFVARKPGRYAYHCAAHPVMKGVLIVR